MSRDVLPDFLDTPRLPSVETQTVAFVEAARARNQEGIVSSPVSWRGFKAYLRYWRNMPMGNVVLGEVLVIATIEIPEALQRRGWFWRYCQLCCALVEHGVVIEQVVNPGLEKALARRPEFKRINSSTFFVEKRGWGDWPLSLLPGEADPNCPMGASRQLQETVMANKTVIRDLQHRLIRWEIEQLRQVGAELRERLERAVAEAVWASDGADV